MVLTASLDHHLVGDLGHINIVGHGIGAVHIASGANVVRRDRHEP